MIDWPPELNGCLLPDGYQESLPDTTIRTQMDVGPPKMRRRSTSAPRLISGTLRLEGSRLDLFEAFYIDTLAGGSLPFNWVSPRTGDPVVAQFGDVPSYSPVSGGIWDVSISLEVLP